MKTRTETFRCFLKILSPVHIGCDEVYEPTSFVVDEAGKTGPEMVVFDPLTFISGLSDPDRIRFSEICKKGNVSSIIEIYKFLKGKTAEGKRVGLCNGFLDHYKKVLALQANEKNITQNLNKFEVKRTSFRIYDERPFIPGSAIKGALRTAYLNACAKTRRLQRPDNKSLQSDLLGYNPSHIETDPFRLVKVSDFQPVGEVASRIVYAVNKKKKISDKEARGPYQILETIVVDSFFTGEVTVEQPVSDSHIRQPVTLENLLAACSDFYGSENVRELSELSQINIKGIKTNGQQHSIPIRIGRHSGAESLTVEGYRNIKIMKGKNERDAYLNKSTTFWLTSETDKAAHNIGLKPFGWASLTPLTPEMEKQMASDEIVFRNTFDMEVLEKIDAKAAKAESALPPAPSKSPEEKAREQAAEKCETFKLMVNASKNISGDIQRLKPMIDNEIDPGAKTEMCRILLEKAMAGDKKKFRKSVKEGKSWAVTIINLCKENQVDTGAFE